MLSSLQPNLWLDRRGPDVRRRLAVAAPKGAVEVREVAEAHHEGDLADGTVKQLRVGEQTVDALKVLIADELREGGTFVLEEGSDIPRADTLPCGGCSHGKVVAIKPRLDVGLDGVQAGGADAAGFEAVRSVAAGADRGGHKVSDVHGDESPERGRREARGRRSR